MIQVRPAENDGHKVLSALQALNNPGEIAQVLGRVEGPYVSSINSLVLF